MEFPIILNLHRFFTDYRSSCQLLITKHNMKQIQDVLNHISRMLKINSKFYLTGDGHYLPELEDVNLLRGCDFIEAVPYTNESITDTTKSPCRNKRKYSMDGTYIIDLVCPTRKVPKKTLCTVVTKQNKTTETEQVIESSAKKKKEKAEDSNLKLVTNENTVDNQKATDSDSDNLELKTWTKLKKKKSKDRNSEELIAKEDIEQEVILDTKPTSVLTVTKKKVLELLPISTKPNIVKAVRVYDNGPENNKSKIDEEVQLLSSSDESETETSIQQSMTEEISCQKQKPKRKRKRKNKNKPKEVMCIDLPVTKPVMTKSPLVTHIRFQDKLDIPNDGGKERLEIAQTEYVNVENDVNYEKMCSEEIVKFPVMEGRLPKEGDIIAFKLYVLSNSYTPEISNFVVAKVMQFCPDTCKVFVQFLEGGRQCREPEGKFFMKDQEQDAERNEFEWASLMEPRLLFP